MPCIFVDTRRYQSFGEAVCHTVRRLTYQKAVFKIKSTPPRIPMCDHSAAPFRTQVCGSRHRKKYKECLQNPTEVPRLFVTVRTNGCGVVQSLDCKSWCYNTAVAQHYQLASMYSVKSVILLAAPTTPY